MKVLYLTPGIFDKGGISRYGRYQVQALRETLGAGSVRVMSLLGRQPGDFETPLEVDFAGAVPLSRASRGLFAGAVARRGLAFRPDVVLCAHVHLGPLALAVARLGRARLVQNVYGLELWPQGGLAARRRWSLRAADQVIADSRNTAAFVADKLTVPGAPVVVRDCVDVDRFTPGAPAHRSLGRYGLQPSARFRLLFLGRISKGSRHKGFERLLQLLTRLPADRFEAVIAGKGDWLERLKGQADELGVRARVTFTGGVDEADLADLYRSADAFYLASECGEGYGEGLPLAPLEAMACGVPVVVGNQDGSREILDGPGGWCGDPGDLASQAAWLEGLAADQAHHAHERQAARRRVESGFSYARFKAELTAALATRLERRAGAGMGETT